MAAKQFVWRYNGDEESDEIQVDLEGKLKIPTQGEKVVRHRKRWFVGHVNKYETLSYPPAVPVYRIFLRDTVA